MADLLTNFQYRILKKISPGTPSLMTGSAYDGKSKIAVLLGESLLSELRDKVVVDFGCGEGLQAVELALAGARKVIGLDIVESALVKARERAAGSGVAQICEFTSQSSEPADVIVSLDAFEHFGDPAGILTMMYGLLKPGGSAIISFGPTWYHPLGGHLFSVFPWSHLVFSEEALIRWRSDLRSDGATRFSEVEGGLNQMTIKRFEGLVEASPFELAHFEAVPIRKWPLPLLHNNMTREFLTATVRCRLQKRKLIRLGS